MGENMEEINLKEKKLMVLALNLGTLTTRDCLRVYRAKAHIRDKLERLESLGYLGITEFGHFAITEKGKDALGVKQDRVLTEFQENKN